MTDKTPKTPSPAPTSPVNELPSRPLKTAQSWVTWTKYLFFTPVHLLSKTSLHIIANVFWLILLFILGGIWLVNTQSGFQASLLLLKPFLPFKIETNKLEGTWVGGMTADQLIYDDGKTRVTLNQFMLEHNPIGLLNQRVDIELIVADKLVVEVTPNDKPVHIPASLDIPFDIQINQAKLNTLSIIHRTDGHRLFELDQLSARGKTAGTGQNKHYVLQNVQAHYEGYGTNLTAQGEGSIAVHAPFVLKTTITASGEQRFSNSQFSPIKLDINLQSKGTLANHQYQLKARSSDEHQGLKGEASVTLTPFVHDAFVVRNANIDLMGIDPSQFFKHAPYAQLALKADLKPEPLAMDVPLATDKPAKKNTKVTDNLTKNATLPVTLVGPVRIRNLSPGTFDGTEKAIPLVQLDSQLRLQAHRLWLQDLTAQLFKGGEIKGNLDIAWPHTTEPTPRQAAVIFSSALDVSHINLQGFSETLQNTEINGKVMAKGNEHEQNVEAKLSDPRFEAALLINANYPKIILHEARLTLIQNRDNFSSKQPAGTAVVQGSINLSGAQDFNTKVIISQFNPAVIINMPTTNLNAEIHAQGTLSGKQNFSGQVNLFDSWIASDASNNRRNISGQLSCRIENRQLQLLEGNLDMAGNLIKVNGALGQAGQSLKITMEAAAPSRWVNGLEGKANAEFNIEGPFSSLNTKMSFRSNGLSLATKSGRKHYVEKIDLDASINHFDLFSLRTTNNQSASLTNTLSKTIVNGKASMTQYRHPTQAFANTSKAEIMIDGTLAKHNIKVNWLATAKDYLSSDLSGGILSNAGWTQTEWRGQVQHLQAGSPDNAGDNVLTLQKPAALQINRQQLQLSEAGFQLNGSLSPNEFSATLNDLVIRSNEIITHGQFTGLPMRREGLALIQRPRDPGSLTRPAILLMGGQWNLNIGDAISGDLRIAREAGDLYLDIDHRESAKLLNLELLIKAQRRASDLSDIGIDFHAVGERLGQTDGKVNLSLQKTAKGFGLSPTLPLNLRLKANIPSLDWIGVALGDRTQTGGSLLADLEVHRESGNWYSNGEFSADNLKIALIDSGIRLENGTVRAQLSQDKLALSQFTFYSLQKNRPKDKRLDMLANDEEKGVLNITGNLQLSSLNGEFLLDMDRFLAMQNIDRWIKVSGKSKLDITKESATLTGQLVADGGLIHYDRRTTQGAAPTLSNDIVIKDDYRFKETNNNQRYKLFMDISADLGEKLYFQGEGVDTRLSGQLRLRSEPGRDSQAPIRATGTVQLQDGFYEAYSQKLLIERGILNFQGALDNPGLDILAMRKGLAVEAGVSITRTAANPLVKLYSSPVVSDYEKLSWLVFGRAPDQGGSGDSAVLLSAASAILGGNKAGTKGFASDLAENLGFDQLSVSSGSLLYGNTILPSRTVAGATGLGPVSTGATSAIGGTQNVNNQIVSIGKRLSALAYISYEQALTGTGNLVKLTYQLSRRLSVIARAGTDNALDLVYAFSFD